MTDPDPATVPLPVEFTLDGAPHRGRVLPRTTLADYLTGLDRPVHAGCEQGSCGVCLVLVDGLPRHACLTLAVQVDGQVVETVAGRSRAGELTAVQRAIARHGGLQCGYCTPAFVLTLETLAKVGVRPEPAAVRAALSGVACRCTGYAGLVAAAMDLLRAPARCHDPGQGGGAADAPRVEDHRLLTGAGRFLRRQHPPGMLTVRFVRSEVPHGRLERLSVEQAAVLPGVVAVLTGEQLPEHARRFADTGEPVLPRPGEQVRYVGQPVAAVVAAGRAAAADAAAAVQMAITALPVADPAEEADLAGVAGPMAVQRVGAEFRVAARDAAVTVRQRFRIGRQTAMPLEPRGLLAAWDPATGRLDLWGLTKHPRQSREQIAAMLAVDPAQIRTHPVDIGGGFGVKGELYPEDIVVSYASRRLGRPVRWLEDQAEHLVAANHSREQVWEVAMAAGADGQILAVEAVVRSDAGAYRRPLTELVPLLATAMFPGPYRMPSFHASVAHRYTNKTPIGTLRAPGRFEANFVRERMLDLVARRLGLDRHELRLRCLLRPADLPYPVGTVNEGPVRYDEGDFPQLYQHALRLRGSAGELTPGHRRGYAVVPVVDKAGLGAAETATVRLEADGRVLVFVDTAPAGQGHQTLFARVAAEALGIDPAAITVTCGDSEAPSAGLGTFASRSAMMAGNAVLAAARGLHRELRAAAERGYGDHPGPIGLAGASLTRAGVRLGDLASVGAPLQVTEVYESEEHTYPYGALGAVVDVCPQTFRTSVRRLWLVCDVGVVLDRRSVVGQLTGAVVQGVGGALFEELPYTRSGEPIARQFADYQIPAANDVPPVEVVLWESRATGNPLGVRGAGEVGIAAAGAVIAGAIADALPEIAEEIVELPLTPARLCRWWERRCADRSAP